MFSICVFIFIAINILFWFQFYLIITGQTSVEYHLNKRLKSKAFKEGRQFRNPYDLGLSRNFKTFYGLEQGDWWFKWLIPSMTRTKGNGIEYEKREREV